MMQDQLERSRSETEVIMRMKGEVEGLLAGLGNAKLVEEEKGGEKEDRDGVEEEGKDVWEEIWRVFG